METTPIKPSIQRKPAGFLMVQANGKFSAPKPLYATPTGIVLKIGSDPTNHIIIKKAEVAPFHAELRQVSYQGQTKVIIQDCRPNAEFLPILVGDKTVPTQSTLVIPQDMPKICIGKHTLLFMYSIPPMLLAMYPQLAQKEWAQQQIDNTTTSATNSLSQSQNTDMLSQMLSQQSVQTPNVTVKKEQPTITTPQQQYLQERTLTSSTSGSMHSESEPETQPSLPDLTPTPSTEKSDVVETNPENSAKDVPQPYSLSFSQTGEEEEEEQTKEAPKPAPKAAPKSASKGPRGRKPSKKTEDHESTAESTVEGIKNSDHESAVSETSEIEPASKKKPAPKSAKKKTTKTPKKKATKQESEREESSREEPSREERITEEQPEKEPQRSEAEESLSEKDLVAQALDMLEDSEPASESGESSSAEVRKRTTKTPAKKQTKTPLRKTNTKTPAKSAKKKRDPNDWTCETCHINKQANMVDCQNCGAWHHVRCVGYGDKLFFWCDKCKATQDPIKEEDDAECPLCRHVYTDNPALTMINCDGGCGNWFHTVCLGMPAQMDDPNMDFMCDDCQAEGRSKVEHSEQEEEEPVMEKVKHVAPPSPTDDTKIVVDLRKGSQSAKAVKTKKVTQKAPNTVAASKSRKVITSTPKKTPGKKAAAKPVPPSDSEGQEPSSSDESDSDEQENVYDTFKLRQKEGQFVPKVSSKFAYFKSPPMDLAKTRLQQKTSPAPKRLF